MASSNGLCVGKSVIECEYLSNKREKYNECITTHYFNHKISVLLPGCTELDPDIMSTLSDTWFFLVEDVPVSSLLKEDFIEAFIKKGHIYMLSMGTRMDSDDCIAILPTGELLLYLTKDTYLELGLTGSPSIHHQKHKEKYVVRVPLSADFFKPDKKYCQRVHWCFERRPDLKFSFLLAWEPNDPLICPSSIGEYFRSIPGVRCQECQLKASRRILDPLSIPVLDSISGLQGDLETSCGVESFMEWLGAVSCNVDCSGKPDKYENTFSTPSPANPNSYALLCTFTGFFTPACIQILMEIIRNNLSDSAGSSPWVALTVHGFQDSPVSWKSREHGYLASGDNFYSFVVFPDDVCWSYKGLGSNDIVL